ncbi:hypothetical protein N7495_006620 [Penicillium taxi]|uniref:uncharacterized protein n=1 Tax=Penicillium taxi TaxID=168475 RepID=UPI00254532AB|nr:uncharacterized protein N7495_006620 [Penicillium taxi]KAJ5894929.1 hypothetical protein N7495_006620 [Penicillium taxi]
MPKIITVLCTLVAAAVATNPTISYGGSFYNDCSSVSTSASVYDGSCVNIENFPLKSFSAYIASGTCPDGTSAVFSTYTASGCDNSTLYEAVSVDSDKQCFEADVTLISLSAACV